MLDARTRVGCKDMPARRVVAHYRGAAATPMLRGAVNPAIVVPDEQHAHTSAPPLVRPPGRAAAAPRAQITHTHNSQYPVRPETRAGRFPCDRACRSRSCQTD